MPVLGYDPARISQLDRRARRALDHLWQLWAVGDPLADQAMSIARLVRAHLEDGWLPALARIGASTAMTEFSTIDVAMMPLRAPARGDESGPPASNSLDSELNPSNPADVPEPRAPITTATIDGWTYTCGPVSASTGQPASGCEWMPPTSWDMSGALLALSFAPGIGELIDAYDCLRGDIPCELMAVPFVSGRGVNAADELLTGASRAADVVRPVTPSNPLDSWGRADTLEEHFVRHGADFASTSAEDYARQASAFLVRGVSENLPTKIDPRTGIIRIWDPATDAFGSFNPDGTTRTYYVLNPTKYGFATSADYWANQPG